MRDNFVTLLQCYSSIYNHIFTRISTYILYIYKYIYYIRNICETKLIVFLTVTLKRVTPIVPTWTIT